MASISIETVREIYPGMTDEQAAAAMAAKEGYAVIVRYKLFSDKPHSNFGLCWNYQEADNYIFNRNLHDIETIYDRRSDQSAQLKVTIHNATAIKRNITFKDDGTASEACCWSCRLFSVSLSGQHLCCRDSVLGKGNPELVDRRDICLRGRQGARASRHEEHGRVYAMQPIA